MAFVIGDKVRETSTTTGTGPITLAGAATPGYRTFASTIGANNQTFYVISGRYTLQWEVGICTLDSTGTILSRTTVVSSSNNNALVNLVADTYDVYVSQPAEFSMYVEGTNVVIPNNATVPIISGGTGASTAAQALANLGALPLAGGTMTGALTLSQDASQPMQAVTYEQLQAVVSGSTYKAAVYCATTGALTATFVNNSGVGDTLTNSGALAVFSTDGIAGTAGMRVLVWGQATSTQNGIYTITNVGSASVAWVLTRSTDYDQAAQIQLGDLIPVEYGNIYAGAIFLETSSVATINTSPITFQTFVQPSLFLLKSGGTLTGTLNTDSQIVSTVATGIAPFAVSSTTPVTNLSIGGTANTATNIVGGAAGSIPYQTATNATALLATGTGVLVGGATPSYTTTPALTGTNFSGIPNTALTGFGASSGIATLDGTGKLTSAQIPASLVGALVYQGTWNASTNTPSLASGVGTKGNYYKVSVEGTTLIDGNNQWNAGDTIVFDGTTWDKIDGIANEVLSISGTANQIVASASTGVITLSLPATINVNTSGSSATTLQTNFTNLTIGGSQVLDASNFNGYSPTLTGTGASGTWSISISGNAATSTNATLAAEATSVSGGAVNELLIQTAAGTTNFVTAPTTTGELLSFSGTSISWVPNPITYATQYKFTW